MTVMAQSKSSKSRRRRGVILTQQGLEKLQKAKSDAEYLDNHGNRYTLEVLSAKTELAVDTLMKVFACESGVDKQTLKTCFKAFNLSLTAQDFYRPELSSTEVEQPLLLEPELPEGQVPLNSQFYVERSPVESDCYKAILQPGALIRLKAARRMGKSSLLAKIVNYGINNGCSSVSLSLQLADKNLFQDLDKFLKWFCANISLSLHIPNKIADYWDDLFGSKISCKIYFEQYILANLKTPLVLALDDVDRLFQYPDLADDFFALLRAWHEEGKNRDIWKKLRLVVAHSSEVYIPLNVNHSPFNVGIPIELPMLTPQQVQDLAKRYELSWSLQQVNKLMDLVGGHPYLIRLALYYVWRKDVKLECILKTDFQSPNHIYPTFRTSFVPKKIMAWNPARTQWANK
ncbi:AAA-like domain-containing protein [Crocosphaera sp. UHCC 0190]|uniref:AAA-like domain-containing protein n=1 Tax=Crocosphaera sp. UHCC 0190 TaxID=3110246 RepID=UPI002B20A9D2|nr:AAA-like domain-containing protein [Crocosphaera sp. UHCC 0190]MEA5508135.1 AAA-like domain-containing protein [Crocosphaera sp. UHCC 0190]